MLLRVRLFLFFSCLRAQQYSQYTNNSESSDILRTKALKYNPILMSVFSLKKQCCVSVRMVLFTENVTKRSKPTFVGTLALLHVISFSSTSGVTYHTTDRILSKIYKPILFYNTLTCISTESLSIIKCGWTTKQINII